MRRLGQIPLTLLFMALALGVNHAKQPKPRLSKDPLTPEQVAIYRAVLAQYVGKDSSAALNIANRTEPFGSHLPGGEDECSKGLPMETVTQPPIVHDLSPAVALGPNMVLVDPKRQAKLVRKNDPDNLLHQHKAISDSELHDSVAQAFSTGLFTFSEILFDKSHEHALLSYSFWCGGLCGHGKTLMMKKSEGKWITDRECSSWIS